MLFAESLATHGPPELRRIGWTGKTVSRIAWTPENTLDKLVAILVELDDFGLINKPGPVGSGNNNNE